MEYTLKYSLKGFQMSDEDDWDEGPSIKEWKDPFKEFPSLNENQERMKRSIEDRNRGVSLAYKLRKWFADGK